MDLLVVEDPGVPERGGVQHVLAQAVQRIRPQADLGIGPPVTDGFYYDFFSPSGQVVRGAEDYKAIEKAMAKLSDSHREILILREVQGLSYEELSEILGVARGTVMSRLHHARGKLKGYLEK